MAQQQLLLGHLGFMGQVHPEPHPKAHTVSLEALWAAKEQEEHPPPPSGAAVPNTSTTAILAAEHHLCVLCCNPDAQAQL